MMKNQVNKLSVIIPVYNVENYLPKCLDSVINQTYKNLQIILVNDGSTDNSRFICEDYKNKDSRVQVINKSNGGLSSARNAGLDNVEGEFVAFLDSDDWIDETMYEELMNLFNNHNVEVAACGLKEIYDDKVKFEPYTNKVSIYDRVMAINSLVSSKKSVRFEVWNKVFKYDLIKDIKFKEKQVFEDVYFNRKVFLNLNKLAFIDMPFHNYLKVREGNTNSYFNDNKLVVFKEFDDFILDLSNAGLIDSSKLFEAFALEFSISLYCDAYRLSVSNETKNRLKDEHKKYHFKSRNNIHFKRVKSLLFLYSPNLFALLSNFKSKVL